MGDCKTLNYAIAGKAKFASLLCGKGKLELTKLSSSALLGVARLIPDCARPTRAFSGRALREQRGRPGYAVFFCGSSIFSPFLNTP